MPPRTRATLPLLLSLAALLLLALLATRGRSAVPRGRGLVLNPPTTTPPSATPAPPATSGAPLNSVLGLSVTAVLLIALAAVLVASAMAVGLLAVLSSRRRRRAARSRPPTGDPQVGAGGDVTVALLRGTRSALDLLRQRTGGPPEDAVQRAWLALEHAAADSGTTRRPEQTSTEFTAALLGQHAVDPAAVTTLRRLYQRARFGLPGAVTEADARLAVDALDRIAAGLNVEPEVTR